LELRGWGKRLKKKKEGKRNFEHEDSRKQRLEAKEKLLIPIETNKKIRKGFYRG
jgi:hypothetical protein